MRIAAYFIFPNKDEDFNALGNVPETYHKLINDVASVKKQLKNHKEFELCYDSENVNCFLEKIESLLNGIYLDNCKNIIRNLFSNHSKNVKTVSDCNLECTYVNWNFSKFEVTYADKIISEISEATLSKNNKTILINIANAYPTDKDAIHVIKDAIHINDLPILISTQIASSTADFEEWYISVSSTGFSLRDIHKFNKTPWMWQKQSIYRCQKTGHLWYFDYFHKDNKKHYEVFDNRGNHLGEADENGELKDGTSSNNKSIKDIIK
jgi:DNA-directed RNA polymerase subunit F